MSLSPWNELSLITAAQQGDESAKLTLLAEYEPNLRRIVSQNPGYDRDDLRSELTIALLETIDAFDPARGERLWPAFNRGRKNKALDAVAESLYAVDVPASTAQLARKVQRRVDAGETLEDVIADEPNITESTLRLVESAFGARSLADYDDEPEQAPDRTTELAEVALDGMTPRQERLAKIKYGFEVPIPTDCNGIGLPDAEVAQHYSAEVIGVERAELGELALSRRQVARELSNGLTTGLLAVSSYLKSEGQA